MMKYDEVCDSDINTDSSSSSELDSDTDSEFDEKQILKSLLLLNNINKKNFKKNLFLPSLKKFLKADKVKKQIYIVKKNTR